MNVRPAPFALTPATIAATIGDSTAGRIVHVPIETLPLVDQPDGSRVIIGVDLASGPDSCVVTTFEDGRITNIRLVPLGRDGAE